MRIGTPSPRPSTTTWMLPLPAPVLAALSSSTGRKPAAAHVGEHQVGDGALVPGGRGGLGQAQEEVEQLTHEGRPSPARSAVRVTGSDGTPAPPVLLPAALTTA